MDGLRWKLSLVAFWLWLKVTPEHPLKHEILDSIADIGRKWRTPRNPPG